MEGAERREKITKWRIVVLVYNKQKKKKEIKMRRAERWRDSERHLKQEQSGNAETGGKVCKHSKR